MARVKTGKKRVLRKLRGEFSELVERAEGYHDKQMRDMLDQGEELRFGWVPFEQRVAQVRSQVQQQGAAGYRKEAPTLRIWNDRPTKLIIEQEQSPGDLLMLTAAIRDLHAAYPGRFMTDVRTPCPQLWENNPHITAIDDNDEDAQRFRAEYNLVHECNEAPYHFLFGFHDDLEIRLGIRVPPTKFKGDIHLSADERAWYSQVRELLGKDVPFWIIDAGRKNDFTAKMWDVAKMQQVVSSCPDILFVQIGALDRLKCYHCGHEISCNGRTYEGSFKCPECGKGMARENVGHYHPPLDGDNVLNLVGKTDIRQLVRLVYHAAGVITPVSFPMHLAAAVPVKPCYHRAQRPCIVVAGGREPSQWEAYTNHRFLHTCGMLPCCDNGGCWASRVYPLGDGDEKDTENLCQHVVETPEGQRLPQCMDMIAAEDVVTAIRQYLAFYDYSSDDCDEWHVRDEPAGI